MDYAQCHRIRCLRECVALNRIHFDFALRIGVDRRAEKLPRLLSLFMFSSFDILPFFRSAPNAYVKY